MTLNATVVTLTFDSDFSVTQMGFEIKFTVQSAASTGMKITDSHVREDKLM